MNEKGNALFILLITLAILGVLTYTVTQSGDSVSQNRDSETAYLAASDMFKYAARLESALERVRLVNGCDLTEISFDHADFTNGGSPGYYENANAPSDGSCDIFNVKGGNAPYFTPPELAAVGGGTEYNIQNNIEVFGLGDAGESELMLTTFVTEDICFQINNLANVTNPSGSPPEFTAAATFSLPGTTSETFPDFSSQTSGFNSPAFDIGGDAGGEAPELASRPTGCFLASNSLNKYVFYHVLSKR